MIDAEKVPTMVIQAIDAINPLQMAAAMKNITKKGIAKTMNRNGAIIMTAKSKAKLATIIKLSRGVITGIESRFEGTLENPTLQEALELTTPLSSVSITLSFIRLLLFLHATVNGTPRARTSCSIAF